MLTYLLDRLFSAVTGKAPPKEERPRKELVHTFRAPEPVGSYSQGVVAGGMLFCSGQIGLDPQTGELVPGGMRGEADQALRNLRAVLEQVGASLDGVVQTTCYVTDLQEYRDFDEMYAGFFLREPPARAVVEVKGLPKGALVEISCLAQLPSNH